MHSANLHPTAHTAIHLVEAEQPITVEQPPRLAIVPRLISPPDSAGEEAERQAQAQVLLHQADAYLLKGEVEAAIAHYRRALEFDSHLVDAHHGLAEALTQQGDLESAATHYQAAIDLLPLPAVQPEPPVEPEVPELAIEQFPWYEQAAFYLQQGQALCDRQQWEATIAACEQATRLLAPQTALAFRLLGQALQATDQLDEAERCYSQSLAIDSVAETYARLGSVYVEQHCLSEAVTCLEQAIELDPKQAAAYLKLGEVWHQLGNRSQAADCWYHAYRLQPHWATEKIQLQLGKLLVEQNKLKQADWCYRQAIALAPDSPSGYHNLAIVLGRQQHWSEAIHFHQQAIDRQPDNSRFHAALGRALMTIDRWQEAIACFQRICELMPDYEQLQDALVQMERCQRALVAQAYGKMAANLAAGEQWQAAIDAYRQAIDRDSSRVEFQVGLAQALVASGQWEAAIACYQSAIALQPAQSEHRIALAELLLKLDRFEEAAQCYRQALDPTQPTVPVNPAFTLL